MLVKSISATAALLSLSLSAQAETRQFGNVVYEIPKGWDVGGTGDGWQTLLSDLPDDRCEFCYMYIGNAVPDAGDLERFLTENRTTFIDEEDRENAKVMADPVFFDLGGNDAGLVAVLADSTLHIFAAVALADRVQTFGFEGSAYDEEELSHSMEAFQNDFTTMLERASFISDGGRSLLPDAVPGDLAGLWWGTETGWPMGLDGMMHMEIYHTHLMFWPDGHFYRGTPPQGTAVLDRAALLEAANTEFGVYTRSGNSLTLTFANGESKTATIDGTGIILGGTTAYPVELLADGDVIEGTVSSIYFMGFTPGSGVTGGMSSASSTTFHKDGRYEGESFGGAFGNFESGGDYTGGFSTSSDNATGGTYEIRDGLVISTPNDGSPPVADLIFRVYEDILIGERYLKNE